MRDSPANTTWKCGTAAVGRTARTVPRWAQVMSAGAPGTQQPRAEKNTLTTCPTAGGQIAGPAAARAAAAACARAAALAFFETGPGRLFAFFFAVRRGLGAHAAASSFVLTLRACDIPSLLGAIAWLLGATASVSPRVGLDAHGPRLSLPGP